MKTPRGETRRPIPRNRLRAGGSQDAIPLISIIIPVLNEAGTLDAFLRDLLQQKGSFEVIVADGGSTDGTRGVAERFPGVKFVPSGNGRGRQMNEGARQARGEIFLFLHADTTLPPEALRKIEEALRDSSVAAGGFCLQFNHPGGFFRVLSRFSRINHLYCTYGDQGLFLEATTFRQIGGFKDIPVMEDVEIQKRLRAIGKFMKVQEPVVTSARRYLRKGALRQHAITSGVVVLYHLGVPPHLLGRWYYGGRSRKESR